MLEEGTFHELGIIVVDELHMLDDPHRGYLLEFLLSKVLLKNKQQLLQQQQQQPGVETKTPTDTNSPSLMAPPVGSSSLVQIVGMSATLANASDVRNFLCATLYQATKRPVSLTEVPLFAPFSIHHCL
jgi:DNA polymerase theta